MDVDVLKKIFTITTLGKNPTNKVNPTSILEHINIQKYIHSRNPGYILVRKQTSDIEDIIKKI